MSAGNERDEQGNEQPRDNQFEDTRGEPRQDEGIGATPTEGVREDGAPAEPTPEQRIADLEAEVAATKDKWLRAVADHENYKKRVKRETDEAVLRAIQNLLPGFLPVMDNLERALEAAEPLARQVSEANSASFQQLLMGLKMVRDEFNAALGRNGIEAVQSVGIAFDPAVHDALQQVDSPDHEPGVVIREFERGYKMGDRLLRPARVIVAGPGSSGKSPGGEGTEA